MKVSKQARRDAKQLFRATLVEGRLDESRARSAVQKLVELKPRGHMGILCHLQRLLRLEVARRSARVESAVPLTPVFQTGIQGTLSRIYGAGLDFQFVHNPALIGGLRVKVGSDVVDGSVLARLNELKEKF
jgi:F-type H+-transporting ATPase subunit delta